MASNPIRGPTSSSVREAFAVLIASIQSENCFNEKSVSSENLSLSESHIRKSDNDVLVLETVRQVVENEVARRTVALRRSRNSVSHLYQLPYELQIHILEDAIQGTPDPSRRAAQLSTVSSLWFEIIPKAPSLWASVQADSPIWQQALVRSKDLPIDIYIESDIDEDRDPFIDNILPQVHRWRTFRGPSYCERGDLAEAFTNMMPLLESMDLSLWAPKPFIMAGGPRLRDIEISADVIWAGALLPKLESLYIRDVQINGAPWIIGLLEALKDSPRLRELSLASLERDPHYDDLELPPYTPLTFPNLTTVSLTDVPPVIPSAISSVTGTTHLSTFDIDRYSKSDYLDAVFGPIIQGRDRGHLPTCVKCLKISTLAVTIERDDLFLKVDSTGRIEVDDITNGGEAGMRVARALPRSVLVDLSLKLGWRVGARERITAASFVELLSLDKVAVNDVEDALVMLTSLLCKDASQRGYLCPSLTFFQFHFSLCHLPKGRELLELIHRLGAVRPDVVVHDHFEVGPGDPDFARPKTDNADHEVVCQKLPPTPRPKQSLGSKTDLHTSPRDRVHPLMIEMHKFWTVPELTLGLAEFLDLQSRSRLSQVNKQLHVTIIKLVWGKLPSVDPLLQLVPGWSPDWGKEILFDGNIALDRFNVYAPFVKDTTLPINSASVKSLLRIAKLNDLHSILPSLLHARVCVDLAVCSDLFAALPPSLLTLELYCIVAFSGKSDPEADVVKIPTSTFSSLRTLSISSSQARAIRPETCDKVVRFLEDHRQTLNALTLNAYADDDGALAILKVVAALPYLRDLTLGTGWLMGDDLPWPRGYATLRELCVYCPESSFLCTIPPMLETLDLDTSLENLEAIGDELARFQHLKSITIFLYDGPVTFETLSALTNCAELQYFFLTMEVDEPIELVDEDFARLVKAWPDLRTLKLGMSTEPCMSLRGLECLAEYCPKLETLHITVDANGVGDAPVKRSALNVKDLELGYTLVGENVDAVARFIGDMWPNRERGRSSWEDDAEEGDDDLELWEEIWTLADQRSLKWQEEHQAAG